MNTIIKPIVSEKSSQAIEDNQFSFWVDLNSNKIQVRQDVEKKFGVKVKKVRVLVLKGKERTRGRIKGRTQDRKKAIVTLQKGQEVDQIKKLF